MKFLIKFIKQKWFIQSVGVIAICVMIWFAGPLFGFAGKRILAPEINRLLVILFIVVIWVVYNLGVRARSGKIDQQLMDKIAESELEVEEKQREELKILRLKFEEALQNLKRIRSNKGRDNQYLYKLPWYVIIGAPGCGKTTLLMNSGIASSFSDHMAFKQGIKGVGGTRNCDWLFTDDAIFLDTAGRYTTQDSHQAVDQAAWEGFLKLIKEFRSRRPINGVLVATSISDLLGKTDEQRQQHAREVRKRIEELHEILGIKFPIYMVFTKCDLIAGFSDFFAFFRPEERAQVWGRTFERNDPEQTNAFLTGFNTDFEELLTRLNRMMLNRVHEEPDIRRRSLIMDFPRQMALIKPAIMDFIHRTFDSSRFERPLLTRGIYFTSATQEGMPIDRIMGVLSKTYGLDEQTVPIYSGEGKSYFIYDLLAKVVFPESEMAGADPRVEHRKRWLKYLAYATVLVVTSAVFLGWMLSFVNNKGYLVEIKDAVAGYENISGTANDWESGVKNLHEKLALFKSAGLVQENSAEWMGMGLDQRSKINDQIDRSYEKSLKAQLLPVITRRLEQRLAVGIAQFSSMNQDKAGDLYDLLKVYLMLERRSPEQRKADLDLAVKIIGEDWDKNFQREPEQFRVDYRTHMKDLLLSDFKRDLKPLNAILITDAREKLNSVPLYKQIYNQLKSAYLPIKKYDFQVEDILFIEQIFGPSILKMSIPGLYTAIGYDEIFNKQGTGFIENAIQQNWVLENADAEKGTADAKTLYDNLQRVYFIDYIQKWAFLLNKLSIKPSKDVYHTNKILHRLTAGKDNPLKKLLKEIDANTSFLEGKAPFSEELSRKIKQFKRLNELIKESEDDPPLLDEIITRLEKLRDLMDRYDSSDVALDDLKQRIQSGGDLITSTRKYAEQLPGPFNTWLSSLTASARKTMLKSAKLELNSIWKAEVVAPYRETLAGRYPLLKSSSEDVSLDDFNRFFQSNGIIDTFLREYIKPFSNADWEEKVIDNHRLGLVSAGSLEQFKRSERIRQIYFMGNPTPFIKFELKPESLDASAKEFQLSIGGKTIKYSHGRSRTQTFQWPESGGSPVSVVEWGFRTFDGNVFQDRKEGPWAWFRALDSTRMTRKSKNQFTVTFTVNGHDASYRMVAGSVVNPFGSIELQSFHCPEAL
ncbi:type VI secretion system membrane subunit TssM [uncultured Desulfobacter sp.]|uniref:type VI secretion system membrane subunit TssM n=1 Tax=uncultured Desulfobacter sp. TaxID=240139 RepID=UPI0029F45CE0|nr:type VI secretion system membrane subunit TssM [uncultured Desulfobacter sp.]